MAKIIQQIQCRFSSKSLELNVTIIIIDQLLRSGVATCYNYAAGSALGGKVSDSKIKFVIVVEH